MHNPPTTGLRTFAWTAVAAVSLLLGCHSKQAPGSDDIVRQAERLDASYLEADLEGARSFLHQEIRLVEDSQAVGRARQAAVLFMACSRLYVLEKWAGNETLAEIALVKGRYWNLRRY